eukprot:NP_496443.2 Uncharacterized protein CELE_W02B12.4 [Caenorhabditis elegans]
MNWVQTGFLLIFLTTLVFFCTADPLETSADSPVLSTGLGYIRGRRVSTKSGFLVDYFTGVPFAEKPERLKKSKLVNRWVDIRNTQQYPPKCIPAARPVNISEFSEDCLYMNILKPSGLNTFRKYPVVVFVHGGGFQEVLFFSILNVLGDGNDASCDAFAEHFVSKEMIVVTIQYRLGMLGFLSLGCSDPLIPCNLGLWDMVTAFRFINATIENFNGDINNMTLMGHSAGAMAVSLHSMSPISSVHFKKYIQLSSSSWGLTRYKDQNIVQTKKILKDLNCDISSAKSIVDCVNSTSLDSMYSAQVDTTLWPEFGDELIPDIPDNMVKNTQNQKVLMGVMTLESLYFSEFRFFVNCQIYKKNVGFVNDLKQCTSYFRAYLKSSPAIFPYIHRDTVEEYINSTIAIQYGIGSESAYDMTSAYYLSANATDNDYGYFMWQRSKIDSNTGFDIPILREARARSQVSPDLYLYHFPYFNPAEFDVDFPVRATYHCHEFPYIWGVYKDNYFEFNDDDRTVSAFLITSLTNFIKTGNPSSSEFNWPLYDSSVSHTVIGPKPTTDKHLFQSDYNFWDSMVQQFQFDLITGLTVESHIETTTSSSSSLTFIPALIILIAIITSA